MMQTKRRSRSRRWLEAVLLIAGLVGIGVWTAGNGVSILGQDWGNWELENQLRGRISTVSGYVSAKVDEIINAFMPVGKISGPRISRPEPRPPGQHSLIMPAIHENDLIGRISIPRLSVTAIVREGVGQKTLGIAAGHIPGTALPGQPGNVAVAAHRDTLFRGLKGIRANDVVQFETPHGNYTYQVESTEVVKPQDVEVLNPGKYSELTLVTCYPFYYVGSAPNRFIVKAREISPGPDAAKTQVAESEVQPHPATAAAAMVALEEPPQEPAPIRDPAPAGRLRFEVERGHSQTLAPGISIGIDATNPTDQRVNGWIWIMPGRRTVWLRNQSTQDPVRFDGGDDGKRHELFITRVSSRAVAGYLQVAR